jgi:hypothetical protein
MLLVVMELVVLQQTERQTEEMALKAVEKTLSAVQAVQV